MKYYLFEIYTDDGSVYQEVGASDYESAKTQLLSEIPDAYILQVFIPYYGEI